MLDHHVHLERGPYTLEWLEQFLRRAGEAGVAELGIAEHLYMFREARHISRRAAGDESRERHLAEYLELMERSRQKGWPVLFGLEVDYFPGKEDETNYLLRSLPLDFAIGSLHWLGDWPFDWDKQSWHGRDVAEVYRRYYDVLGQAAETGLFDILGHPGNIAFYGHYPPEDELASVERDFLQRLKGQDVCIEINSGGFLRPVGQYFPRPQVIEAVVAAGFAITTSSDAHRPEQVGHRLRETYDMLRYHGVERVVRVAGRNRDYLSL